MLIIKVNQLFFKLLPFLLKLPVLRIRNITIVLLLFHFDKFMLDISDLFLDGVKKFLRGHFVVFRVVLALVDFGGVCAGVAGGELLGRGLINPMH